MSLGTSPIFEWVAEALGRSTSLSRLAARGTVRLVLKKGGLEPEGVNSEEMALALERLMPQELSRRGIDESEAMCLMLIEELRRSDLQPARSDSKDPEETFRRIFGH